MRRFSHRLFTIVCGLMFVMVGGFPAPAQEVTSLPKVVFITEFTARLHATAMVLPEYPEGARKQGAAGIVRVKFSTDAKGNVVRLKVQPGVNPLLKKAVTDAVWNWKFRTYIYQSKTTAQINSGLTFNFINDKGTGHVELYNPPKNPNEDERIDLWGSKEYQEWNDWEEVIREH
jgi:TonB family protein